MELQGDYEHPICPVCDKKVFPKQSHVIDMNTELIYHRACYTLPPIFNKDGIEVDKSWLSRFQADWLVWMQNHPHTTEGDMAAGFLRDSSW